MSRTRARLFSQTEKDQLWQRWKQGESISKISRTLGRTTTGVAYILKQSGGIEPAPRKRRDGTLTLAEREVISRAIAAKRSFRTIASLLARSPSTISREVHRNGGIDTYQAMTADKAAEQRARRPKPCKLKCYKKLRETVAKKLSLNWSPQQIDAWLKRQYPMEPCMQVSHETIYRSLFIQTRGVLKKELQKHLRETRRFRHARTKNKDKRGMITELVSIRQRPASIEDRALPGHWEGDLIEGSRNSFIATLVERRTRYVALVKVNSKETREVVSKLTQHAKTIPEQLYQSLTWDRGAELKQHKKFTTDTGIQVYFCDPSSPWQRGSNENTNRLLRQYFPKGTDLSIHSQAQLNHVAQELNERPRKTLDFDTPQNQFLACVALTSFIIRLHRTFASAVICPNQGEEV
jgi:IS30 family transposase